MRDLRSHFLHPLQLQEQGVQFGRRVIRLRYRYRIDAYSRRLIRIRRLEKSRLQMI